METQSVTSDQAGTRVGANTTTTKGLGGDDFFKLLIAQLSNQDPMEPTSSQDLLNQMSSIREIELSTTLTDSLKSLTAQQRFGSAAALIGRFVTGSGGEGGLPVSGVVAAVRFDASGNATLELSDGGRIPLEQIESVTDSALAAESLIGRYAVGVDRSDPTNLAVIEGLVTGTSKDDAGRVMLELDTGQAVAFDDVIELRDANESDEPSGSAG